MYTTPRKVKQESRLRRSLSLTNTSRLNGVSCPTKTDSIEKEDSNSSGEYHRHLHSIEESKDSNTYFQFNEDLNFNHQRSRYSYSNGGASVSSGVPDLVVDNSIFVHSTHPPPYRGPPSGEFISEDPLIVVTPSDPQHQGVPDSPISLDSIQIHSSKFPIVKQVVISTSHPNSSSGNSQAPNFVPLPVLSPEYIKKFQNKKLTTKKQIAWTDERKAFTLDSQTAKDLQERLARLPITRANSADLGKAIQDFNEEQTRLMSSMHGIRRLDGSDRQPHDLSLNPHHHNPANSGKMLGGYNGSDSSTSQSLSLSSSNTDSLDTVIYKGPSQSTTSIRDWQRSMESSGGEFGGHHSSYHGMPYHMQQHPPSSSYPQQMQHYNGSGPNGYAIEYRHSAQQQHQVQQNLSVHSVSVPSSSTGSSGAGVGVTNNLRAGNATTYGSNPQLTVAAKSPMLSHKQFSTAAGQLHSSAEHPTHSRVTFGNAGVGSDPMLVDKGKEPSKVFPSKTYNQIKDMISSRFGHGNMSQSKGLNNSAVNSSGASGASVSNNASGNANGPEQNAANSYIDLTMGIPSCYSNNSNSQIPTGHVLNQNQSNVSQQGMINRNGPYYHQNPGAHGGNVPNSSSYRSPNMSERKNVNTSFRKAIQHSALKSNLTEDSLQLRPIMENGNGGQQFHGGNPEGPGVKERAQRALDQLMEGSAFPHSNSGHNGNATGYRMQSFPSDPQLRSSNPQLQRLPMQHRPYVNPGPGSSNSSSSGPHLVDSSLSSPVGSYGGGVRLASVSQGQGQWSHGHPGGNNSTNGGHHLDQPPPLPTSKKPDSPEGSINTIGLPLSSVEMRENGDGSSATMEAAHGNILLEADPCGKVKSDQLKQITTDLQKLALSVAAERNNNNSSSSECEKGPQRVGSGQSNTTTDSGLGTVMLTKSPLTSNSDAGENPGGPRPNADSVSSGNDSEWVDLVEPEIQHILEIERNAKSGKTEGKNVPGSSGLSGVATSTPSIMKQFAQGGSGLGSSGLASTNPSSKCVQSVSGIADISTSPILHPKHSSHQSPKPSPKPPKKFDLNVYNKKAARAQSQELLAGASTSQAANNANKVKSPRVTAKVQRSNSGAGQQRWPVRPQRPDKSPKMGAKGTNNEFKQTLKGAKITRNAMTKLGQLLHSLQDETGDMTSTTGMDFESAMDGHTEFTTDDDDLSTTIDTTDAHAIRRQLESLESMYTEVLKVLGEKKFSRNRYPPNTAELRAAKRRPYGSMSSLPSSVSSRPFRDRGRKLDDKKKVKDLKSINRRFQRLESHVVTLARSVAHLSSEMRTQHLMVQEMESIRNELQQLRNQVVKNTQQGQISNQNFHRGASGRQGANPCANQTDWTSFRNALPSLTNPCRVRKLTQFFGDEPPLIRIFLKKLGYEKYASAFEQERIGIMELPYLTEERLNKMGIPMGPRLRILQEAQICLKPGYHGHQDGHNAHHNHVPGNLSVYVV